MIKKQKINKDNVVKFPSKLTEIEKEIAHVLNKNSLRFNPYRFRNYILARTKKTDTTKAV